MRKLTQDQHRGFHSSPSWSRDEESTFLDMMVEEFINKQPEAMDALIALVLLRICKITDEGWNRVAKRLTEHTGKKYTMMELEEQMKRFTQGFRCIENLFGPGGPGMDFPPTTFKPYSEHGNDTRVFTSPDEKAHTPKKDAKNSDGWNVGVQYPEDCATDSDKTPGKVSYQQGGPGMDFPRTTFEQSSERENDAGISRSPDENFSILEKEGRISDCFNGSVLHAEESIRNSERSCDNVSNQDIGPGLDFPSATFEPYFEHDNDAGVYWTPDSLHEEDGPGIGSPHATSEPYFEHCNDTGVYSSPVESFSYPGDCVGNSYRSSHNGSHQDGSPGTRESPIDKIPIPEKEVRDFDGSNDSATYLDIAIGNINRSCDNIAHQEGGPGTSFHHTEFVPSDEHDSDAGICQSPIESVSIQEKDSRHSDKSTDGALYTEKSIRKSYRRCGDVLHPQEGIEDSGVTPNVSYPSKNAEENVEDSGVTPNVLYPRECGNAEENVEDSGVNHNVYHIRELEKATEAAGESERRNSSDAEKNSESSTECDNVSSPLVNVESVSQWYDTATGQEENATNSTPRYENYFTEESMGCHKRPAADSFESSDHKRNKWSSYTETNITCGVSQNPDDGDSFSFARCRNILQGMRRIDSQFRDTALDFLEDPYYRKFFMQMKYDKRLDWLSSILGMEH